ncbi:MAG: UvrD-helicase domain-containing protein, partial [Anaerolineae bacterium]|nr:UvrD-helicase domain-containing protein [Anaerolineae bacterium]
MSFTPQQEKAIQTLDKNLIVVAGAGSGKTRVLVERFLYLLQVDETLPLNALVAITFTREAALEMRNRVRKSLEENVQNFPQQVRWSNLLAEMDSARIDTIHGLCATILRANAPEAGIDPRFEVL